MDSYFYCIADYHLRSTRSELTHGVRDHLDVRRRHATTSAYESGARLDDAPGIFGHVLRRAHVKLAALDIARQAGSLLSSCDQPGRVRRPEDQAAIPRGLRWCDRSQERICRMVHRRPENNREEICLSIASSHRGSTGCDQKCALPLFDLAALRVLRSSHSEIGRQRTNES